MKDPYIIRGPMAISRIRESGMCWLGDLEKALAYERAKKRPSAKLVRALVDRIGILSIRRDALAAVDVMKFGPPVSKERLLNLLTFAEQPMRLLEKPTDEVNAARMCHEAASKFISESPDAFWRCYSVNGAHLYFGILAEAVAA